MFGILSSETTYILICIGAFIVSVIIMVFWSDKSSKKKTIRKPQPSLQPQYSPIMERQMIEQQMGQKAFGVREKISTYCLENRFDEVRDIVSAISTECREKSCISTLHFFLLFVIDVVYKRRDDAPDAIPYCLELCDMDISLFGLMEKKFLYVRVVHIV